MSVKYLVGGGNTFFITRCPKLPSLALRYVHHILLPSHCVKHTVTITLCETWQNGQHLVCFLEYVYVYA